MIALVSMLAFDRNLEPQSVMQTSLPRNFSAGELEAGVKMGLRKLLYVSILPHDAMMIYSSGIAQGLGGISRRLYPRVSQLNPAALNNKCRSSSSSTGTSR